MKNATFTFEFNAKAIEDSHSVVTGLRARLTKAGKGRTTRNAGLSGFSKEELSECSEKEKSAISLVNLLLSLEKLAKDFGKLPESVKVNPEKEASKAGKAA